MKRVFILSLLTALFCGVAGAQEVTDAQKAAEEAAKAIAGAPQAETRAFFLIPQPIF